VTHDHEVSGFINGDLARAGGDVDQDGSASPTRKTKSPSRMAAGYAEKLQDPFFASRLEKMSKMSLGQCMYTNEAALAPKKKNNLALYDY
jgi:hypothetical protein